MSPYSSLLLLLPLILFLLLSTPVLSDEDNCGAEENNKCNNKKKALPLKIIAIFSIFITSMIGVCLPLVTRSIPALSPDRSLFVIVKAFAAGIILATEFVHVLPESFEMLSSSCLNENPWHKFPFTGFVAMLSAIIVLMIDSIVTSFYSKKHKCGLVLSGSGSVDTETAVVVEAARVDGSQILRYRVIAVVVELGIIVHSVVIGLSVGASNNTCSIKGLIIALCFHQMFEGMGLGPWWLHSPEYKFVEKVAMVFFFAVTTPFGIVLGLALARTYQENSPRALITVGLLNASSSGLLIYMALVDLLAAEFMGPELQGSIKLQLKSVVAVLFGMGGMCLTAKWA